MRPTDDREVIARIISHLDFRDQRQLHAGEQVQEYWGKRRRHPRHPFITSCTVRFVSPDLSEVFVVKGWTRNISRGGLAILAKQLFDVGDPLEIELELPSRGRMFMAGLVQFVGYAGEGYYQLGVSLRARDSRPILSWDPRAAFKEISWLRECRRVQIR